MIGEFQKSVSIFEQYGIENPASEIRHLSHIISGGTSKNLSTSTIDAFLDKRNIDIHHVAQKRKLGTPMEHILRRTAFAGLRLHCSEDTFIPTPETELLVEVASQAIRNRQKTEADQTIVEIGVGCGNLSISLALNTDNTTILASDISPSALEIAQKNVDKFSLNERIFLFCGDFLSPFEGLGYENRIDLLLCNPPYIPTASLSKISPEIIGHQPTIALDAGPYGIDFYRKLIIGSVSMLKPGGVLVFEIGERQEKLVDRIFQKAGGYRDITYFRDTDEQVRVISAVKVRE